MPGIKITGMWATPTNIPLEKPMWWTGGHYPGTSKTIIEVQTDQSLVGLGEAPSGGVVERIHAMGERLIGMRNYEDPVATFEEMAELQKHSSIRMSTHVPDIRRCVALGAPGYIVTNFAVLRGISRALRFIGVCEAMGVGFWCYSGDAGIATVAYLHMSAAMPLITEPSQSLFRWQTGDVIEDGPSRQTVNTVAVPEGQGLGVTLDRDALNFWHKHLLDNGPLDHFRDPKQPGVFRRIPLH